MLLADSEDMNVAFLGTTRSLRISKSPDLSQNYPMTIILAQFRVVAF